MATRKKARRKATKKARKAAPRKRSTPRRTMAKKKTTRRRRSIARPAPRRRRSASRGRKGNITGVLMQVLLGAGGAIAGGILIPKVMKNSTPTAQAGVAAAVGIGTAAFFPAAAPVGIGMAIGGTARLASGLLKLPAPLNGPARLSPAELAMVEGLVQGGVNGGAQGMLNGPAQQSLNGTAQASLNGYGDMLNGYAGPFASTSESERQLLGNG